MKQQEMDKIVTFLAVRIHNLEYQLRNKSLLSQEELSQIEQDYQKDKADIMQIILVTAKEMGYPQIQDWSDTEPMSVVNRMSELKLASTEMYQGLLVRIMMGTITSA